MFPPVKKINGDLPMKIKGSHPFAVEGRNA
jgi:hypothetical protein